MGMLNVLDELVTEIALHEQILDSETDTPSGQGSLSCWPHITQWFIQFTFKLSSTKTRKITHLNQMSKADSFNTPATQQLNCKKLGYYVYYAFITQKTPIKVHWFVSVPLRCGNLNRIFILSPCLCSFVLFSFIHSLYKINLNAVKLIKEHQRSWLHKLM